MVDGQFSVMYFILLQMCEWL